MRVGPSSRTTSASPSGCSVGDADAVAGRSADAVAGELADADAGVLAEADAPADGAAAGEVAGAAAAAAILASISTCESYTSAHYDNLLWAGEGEGVLVDMQTMRIRRPDLQAG